MDELDEFNEAPQNIHRDITNHTNGNNLYRNPNHLHGDDDDDLDIISTNHDILDTDLLNETDGDIDTLILSTEDLLMNRNLDNASNNNLLYLSNSDSINFDTSSNNRVV
jgi:hypothetical protein